jgi:GTP-binding protein
LAAALGVYKQKVLADIPGLIEGASAGKGLGIGFLKHIEKVKVILHCISCESNDVLKDYETVRTELGKFNQNLLTKKEVILLTKSDLVDAEYLEIAKELLKDKSEDILTVSIDDQVSIQDLKNILQSDL